MLNSNFDSVKEAGRLLFKTLNIATRFIFFLQLLPNRQANELLHGIFCNSLLNELGSFG